MLHLLLVTLQRTWLGNSFLQGPRPLAFVDNCFTAAVKHFITIFHSNTFNVNMRHDTTQVRPRVAQKRQIL